MSFVVQVMGLALVWFILVAQGRAHDKVHPGFSELLRCSRVARQINERFNIHFDTSRSL